MPDKKPKYKMPSARELAISNTSKADKTYKSKPTLLDVIAKPGERFTINTASRQGNGTIKQITKEEVSKGPSMAEIARNPMTAFKYKIKGQQLPANLHADRNILDKAVDIINPATYIKGVSNTIKNITSPIKTAKTLLKGTANLATQISDNRDAFPGETGKAFGIVGDAAITASIPSGLRNGLNIVDRQFSKIGRELETIRMEGETAGLDAHTIAKNQLEKTGITSNQRKGYIPIVSNLAEKYITPFGYDSMSGGSKISQIIKNIKNSGVKYEKEGVEWTGDTVNSDRADAWRLYLGNPQRDKTFKIADTAPANHPAYPSGSLKGTDVYNINEGLGTSGIVDEPGSKLSDLMSPHTLEKKMNSLRNPVTVDRGNSIMGGYNKRLTKDGTEYNDIWDLEPPITPYNFLPKKIQNKVENIPIVKDIFLKRTENGSIPRSFSIPVDKVLGKPFMSHGILPYNSQDLVNDLTTGLKGKIEGMKAEPDFADMFAPKIKKFETHLRELETMPNFKNGGVVGTYNEGMQDGGWLKKYEAGGIVKGGWLKKYENGGAVQGAGDPITLVTPSGRKVQTSTDTSFYKLHYDNKAIGSQNKDKSWSLNEEIYQGTDLPEVRVSTNKLYPNNVQAQLDYISKGKLEKDNYAIVNKKANRIYFFDGNNNRLGNEPVITGQNNTDRDYSVSMKDWFDKKENKGKTHEDYFNYLGDYESRVTPSGHFTIASLNDHIIENPASWTGKSFNVFKDIISGDKIGTRNSDIEQSRKKAYGSQDKLFTLEDDNGVYSSKAMHGTDNPEREAVLNENSDAKSRDMSNGCINVGDKSKCFTHLKKSSSVYVLPEWEEVGNVVKKNKQLVPQGNMIKKSKSDIVSVLKKNNIKSDDDLVDFISSVHGKETSFGTNKLVPIEDQLPFFKSDGDFQINSTSFKKFLPDNYTNTFDNGVLALYNFYKANKGETPEVMYNLYNSGRKAGSASAVIDRFNTIYNRVKQIH